METPAAVIPAYPVGAFTSSCDSHWLGSLDRILENYPFLEEPHKPQYYLLLFIERATGTVMIDHQLVRCDEPKLIFVKPGGVFSLNINRTAQGSMYCFSDPFLPGPGPYTGYHRNQFSFLGSESGAFVRLNAKQTEKWQLFFRLIRDELSVQQQGYERILTAYTNILLVELARKLRNTKQAEHLSLGETRVLEFEQLVEEQFLKYKTPAWYASELHVTPNYLNKLCRQYRMLKSGEIIRKRIGVEAQRLLRFTSLSVAEIAHLLGFEHASYFVTFFKKQTQLTPEQFRKNNPS